MTKIYETTTGKQIRLNNSQFNKLAEAIYNAVANGYYTVVIGLDDTPDDSLVCYSKRDSFAFQRRVIMPECSTNYDLPLVCFSASVYPPLYSFINMLWCLGDCTVEVYDSDGCICKKVFNLRGV